jgi:hypothetical protein
MEKHPETGRLEIDGKELVYTVTKKELWRIPAIKVCAIGEYTTPAGPFADDYFLVFVLEGGKWHEASFYVNGRDVFLAELSKIYNDHIRPGLAQSTKWNSRVLWPKELEGKELFVLTRKAASGTLLQKLKQKISPEHHLKLSPAVSKLANQLSN